MSNNSNNPFASLKYSGAENLSTDADKLNFQKGALTAAGGLLKKVGDIHEENTVRDFDIKLKNAQRDGDVQTLRLLNEDINIFRDAENRDKYAGLASRSLDVISAGEFTRALTESARMNDLDGHKAITDKIAQTTDLSLDTKQKLLTDAQLARPAVEYGSLLTNSIKESTDSFNTSNSTNISAFDSATKEILAANPNYSDLISSKNGSLILKPVSDQDQLANQKYMANLINDRAMQLGAKTFNTDIDTVAKNLRIKLQAAHVTPEKIEEAEKRLIANYASMTGLGPESRKLEIAAHAKIDQSKELELDALKKKYAVAGQFNEAELKYVIEAGSFKNEDLMSFVNKEFSPSNSLFSGLEGGGDIKTYISANVLGKPIDGKIPTPYEIKNALIALKQEGSISDISGVTQSDIIDAVRLAMKDSPVQSDVLKKNFDSINNYAKDIATINSNTTIKKLEVTGKLKTNVGIANDTVSSTNTLNNALFPKTEVAPKAKNLGDKGFIESKPFINLPPIDFTDSKKKVDVNELFSKLTKQESGNKHTDENGKLITSAAGALGITQVMPKTGINPGFGVDPLKNNSEEEYLRFGREYLSAMLKKYNGDAELAAAAYNAGPAKVDSAIKSGGSNWITKLPKETRDYVAKLTI